MRFELSDAVREAFAQNEPAVKAAVCIIANQKFGIDAPPAGIGKYHGGVVVNGREITIKEHAVMDDFKRRARKDDPTPEERAVACAIEQVAGIVSSKGLQALQGVYGECRIGDPLRSLLISRHI